MSVPSSAGSEAAGRPSAGYYPDPSIPGYIRYWDGDAWLPGTSRPAPTDGQPPAPPRAAARGVAPSMGFVPPPSPRRPVAESFPLEESGPIYLDETNGLPLTGTAPPSSAPSPSAPASEPASVSAEVSAEVSAQPSPPEPSPAPGDAESPWQVDAAQQRGLMETGRVPRWVSWGAPEPDEAPPARVLHLPTSDAHPPQAPAATAPVSSEPDPEPDPLSASGSAGYLFLDSYEDSDGFAAPAGLLPAPASTAVPASRPAAQAPSLAPSPLRAVPDRPAQESGGSASGDGTRPTGPAKAAFAPPPAAFTPAPAPPAPTPPAATPAPAPAAPAPAAAAPEPAPTAAAPAAPAVPAPRRIRAVGARRAGPRPALLGRRLGARLLDVAVVAGAVTPVAVPLVHTVAAHLQQKIDLARTLDGDSTVWLVDPTVLRGAGLLALAVLAVGLVYEVLPTALWGRTLGKALFGLRVLDLRSKRKPGLGRVLLRWLSYQVLLLLAVGVLDLLWCMVDRPWRQCWHDKAGGTFVTSGAAAPPKDA